MDIDFKLSTLVAIGFIVLIVIIVLIRIKFTPDEQFPVFLAQTQQPLVVSRQTPSSQVERELPPFRTGDCVFVSYRSLRGKLVKVFTGSMWSHMGMIYKKADGSAFVIEAVFYDYDQHGVLQTPLYEWLHYNRKRTLAWLPKLGPAIPDSEVDRVFDLVKDADMDTFVINWLKAVVNRQYHPEHKTEFYCSELVATLFQELNVIKKELMPSSYSPKSFMLRKIPCYMNHEFDEPQVFHVPNSLKPNDSRSICPLRPN